MYKLMMGITSILGISVGCITKGFLYGIGIWASYLVIINNI